MPNLKPVYNNLGIKEDFYKGLRVLDIGSFSGAFNFYAEDCGANVVAFDVQSPESNGFSLIHELRNSKVEFILLFVYDINLERLEYFDVVLFLGSSTT